MEDSATSGSSPIAPELLNCSSSHLNLQFKSPSFILAFSNLIYDVHICRKTRFLNCFRWAPVENTRTLLNGISGEARDGEILAVLGPSGSGKSTLIDTLANRIDKESLKGSITMNGEVLESRLWKAISAYVMQDDLLYPMLTVEETLMFAAKFKLPRLLSMSKRKARVEALIDQLGLRDAAKTVIGDEGHRGVSGGERRRVSIGIEIIHDPIVLFLDEPTSGLDSTSAFMVVKVLQRIAQSGSIVIMSIHQPSYRIDGLLDKIVILSQGNVVYTGPPASIPGFFEECGHLVPKNENPTEFAVDLIHELDALPGGTIRLVEFNKQWQTMKNRAERWDQNLPLLSPKDAIRTSILKGKMSHALASSLRITTNNTLFTEIFILTARSSLNSRRTPDVVLMRLGATLLTGFILASIYWKVDKSPKGALELVAFFTYAVSTTFYTCAISVAEFLQERYIFMRETANNTYRPSSYVLSHSLLALPLLAFLSLAFAATIFWSVDLSGGLVGFLFFFCITFASYWAGSSFVTFLSGLIPDVQSGYTVIVTMLNIFFLFMGYFINADRFPPYWIWFHYISLLKAPFAAVMMNEFGDSSNCFAKGTQVFDNTPLESVSAVTRIQLLKTISTSIGVNITGSSCITTGPNILRQVGLNSLTKWDYLWITVAWGFFFRFLFYLTLLYGSKNKRK